MVVSAQLMSSQLPTSGQKKPKSSKSEGSTTSLYVPPQYWGISNRTVKRRLTSVARHFHFLDCCFTYYINLHFRGQKQKPPPLPGGYGKRPVVGFDELDHLEYLQAAREIPFWEAIMRLLLARKTKNNKATTTVAPLELHVIFRTIESVKLDVEVEIHRIRHLPHVTQLERDQMHPVIRGIEKRLDSLRGILDRNSSYRCCAEIEYKEELLAAALFKKPPRDDDHESAANPVVTVAAAITTTPQNENVLIIGLLPLFLLLALAPFSMGFYKSMSAESGAAAAVGSTSDADFWYLMQANLIAVLASFSMIVPLWRQLDLSTAPYLVMAAFWILGLAAAVASVAMYPFVNPGWSNLVSFVGSIASAASVVVMTQATGRQMNQP
ncbi:hypothetical protein PG989_013704 [Apiospora arundinis]